MVFRRVAALGFLAIILSALATVSSCTDPECADGGEGCPCQSVYECGPIPACTTPYCDGSCGLIQLVRWLRLRYRMAFLLDDCLCYR